MSRALPLSAAEVETLQKLSKCTGFIRHGRAQHYPNSVHWRPVARLERLGFVFRHPDPYSAIELTASGRDLLARVSS